MADPKFGPEWDACNPQWTLKLSPTVEEALPRLVDATVERVFRERMEQILEVVKETTANTLRDELDRREWNR